MALHTELPIYRTGIDLLALAVKAQEQMPRGLKRSLGDQIASHCMEMLARMAMANATQREERAAHITALMSHLHATQVLLRVTFDGQHLSPALWVKAILLLDSIGKQGGGWRKRSLSNKAPAA
ncbi:four helix bundle protein [Methylibium sp.]|uniref:four helix bundle protein n=1 Tax=Methylibium sp. TaxID=2067992 RepID=UPI003D0B4EF7